jgi:hypothetical protein
MYLDQKFREI